MIANAGFGTNFIYTQYIVNEHISASPIYSPETLMLYAVFKKLKKEYGNKSYKEVMLHMSENEINNLLFSFRSLPYSLVDGKAVVLFTHKLELTVRERKLVKEKTVSNIGEAVLKLFDMGDSSITY